MAKSDMVGLRLVYVLIQPNVIGLIGDIHVAGVYESEHEAYEKMFNNPDKGYFVKQTFYFDMKKANNG